MTDQQGLIKLYQWMITARYVDQVELDLTNRGEAFFHVSGAGHEATAALTFSLTENDWLHCHYRDKALMIARGLSAQDFFDALMSKHNSHSRGRQMCAHMSDVSLKILSLDGPVGNAALKAVGVAAAIKDQPERPLVYLGVGDGTTQEGEFLEAMAEAVRSNLPVLFVVQDNQWAISTTTRGKTFYSLPRGDAIEMFGIPIDRIDGRDPAEAVTQFKTIVDRIREQRGPAFVVFDVERLTNHTNADDQSVYRDELDIRRANENGDPIRRLEQHLLKNGYPQQELNQLQKQVEAVVNQAELASAAGPDPVATVLAKKPLSVELTHISRERRGDDQTEDGLNMRQAICGVLRNHLQDDPRVSLLGQDIEDPKGDVFGATKGLSTEFPGRVINAPLSEATIVGVSIGRAMAGERPVAFIQFADFLPLAFNQIASDMGSMFWRTDGQWQSPVILMIPCGGYRPGLGPFHAQTFESIMAHTPGIDVFMPSTAADAAGMLNAAFESGRPTLFFYPKGVLNDPRQTTTHDLESQFVPIGPARKVRSGRDLTLVGWGNTVRICEQTSAALEKIGVETEVFDLRSLSPWDERAVLASAEKTARLVVVHEDNSTCGMGGEVLATVAEKARVPVAMRRVARPDTYVPYHFANHLDVMPSFKSVLTTAAELLDLDLSWIPPKKTEPGIFHIEAIGSGPADETVIVVEIQIKPGQTIKRGEIVASLEATKSVFDLTSPVDGTIEDILVAEGDTIDVGQDIIKVSTGEDFGRPRPVTQEQSGVPVLARKPKSATVLIPHHQTEPRQFDVGISSVATTRGSRFVSNEELLSLRNSNGMTPADIVRRTGIESRYWAAEGEDAVNMAVKACWKVLQQEQLILDDLDLLICTTTSPTVVTPSMACRVLNGLASSKTDSLIQAFDINAACSGYLYSLQSGFDYLQSKPNGRVLVVTAEVLSPLLDPNDFDTAILFGDAASATVLYGENYFDRSTAKVRRPELGAKGEDGSTLSVPLLHDGFIKMKGRKVFSEAVRSMVTSLNRVCDHVGVDVDQLRMVVPHQANQRIIDAIQNRVSVPVYSNIRRFGNTSSTSIPLCLTDVLPNSRTGDRIGLCAFGGGFTFGAGLLETL